MPDIFVDRGINFFKIYSRNVSGGVNFDFVGVFYFENIVTKLLRS